MNTDIPEEAKCPAGYDCSLLTEPKSYRSQIVRLAAEEKGIKWKHYQMDIVRKNDQLEPWYVKLNPHAYVPTMLVGVENKPVCESADIITYIEKNFQGKVQL